VVGPDRSRRLPVVLAGGGTGGHALPLMALARELSHRRPEADFLYIGAKGRIEERIARSEGIAFQSVWIGSLRRTFDLRNGLLPLQMTVSAAQASRAILRHRARFVISTGGWSAWPAGQAARLLKKPLFVHESNAYPGLVTRLQAPGAARVFVGYEDALKRIQSPPARIVLSGNPSLMQDAGVSREEARKAFGLDTGRRTLLVTGGSAGARSINRLIYSIMDDLFAQNWSVIWQTGSHRDGEQSSRTEQQGRLVIAPFFEPQRMALAYRAADLVLSRCGAMTLADLAATGRPAILVPYPFAAEGHQEANARAVVDAGGAVTIKDTELSRESFIGALESITGGEPGTTSRLETMSAAMGRLARPDAAARIIDEILQVSGC